MEPLTHDYQGNWFRRRKAQGKSTGGGCCSDEVAEKAREIDLLPRRRAWIQVVAQRGRAGRLRAQNLQDTDTLRNPVTIGHF